MSQTGSVSLEWVDQNSINVEYSIADQAKLLPALTLGNLLSDTVTLDIPFGILIGNGDPALNVIFDQQAVTTAFNSIVREQEFDIAHSENPEARLPQIISTLQRLLLPRVLGQHFHGVAGIYVISRALFLSGKVIHYPRTGTVLRGTSKGTLTELFAYGDFPGLETPHVELLQEGHIRNIYLAPGIIDWDNAAFIQMPGRRGFTKLSPQIRAAIVHPKGIAHEAAFEHLQQAVSVASPRATVGGFITTSVTPPAAK